MVYYICLRFCQPVSICNLQIKELNLDNCRSTQIAGLTEEFKALESLSLINVGLTTLKGFPSLPNLQKVSCGGILIFCDISTYIGCFKPTNVQSNFSP